MATSYTLAAAQNELARATAIEAGAKADLARDTVTDPDVMTDAAILRLLVLEKRKAVLTAAVVLLGG